MTSVSINVDGQIDLTDLADPGDLPEHARADGDRVRTSRLADVMIVMERDRAALEETLRAGLAERVLPEGVAHLALQLDDAAPRFSVVIEPVVAPDVPLTELPADQRTQLEREIATGVAAWIAQRAVSSPTPRWQPQVTATIQTAVDAADSARQGRLKSVWLRILFWLLACMILATAYLYMKGMPS